jgi:hypothetical protein
MGNLIARGQRLDHRYTRCIHIYYKPEYEAIFFCKQQQRKEWFAVNTRPYVISKKQVNDTSSPSFATSINRQGSGPKQPRVQE